MTRLSCSMAARAVGAGALLALASQFGCAVDLDLGYDGCKVGVETLAVGATTPGPCGERCVCQPDGTLACGASACPPDPVAKPCTVLGTTIAPGTTALVEASCQDCTCPAGGAEDVGPAGVDCVPHQKPVACDLPPDCFQSTAETCTECPKCTCLRPPMGCVAQPGCTFLEEGLCLNGDYCGPASCGPACATSASFGLIDVGCMVIGSCDGGGGWSQINFCPCGDPSSLGCEAMPPPQPGCRWDAVCDPMGVPVCSQSCACDEEMSCVANGGVYLPDLFGGCGRCLPCARCSDGTLACTEGMCVDDPAFGCGTCVTF